MTRQEINKRLAVAALDIEHLAFKRKLKAMSDKELLEMIESMSQGEVNLNHMTDEELEILIAGSPKARKSVMSKYQRRL